MVSPVKDAVLPWHDNIGLNFTVDLSWETAGSSWLSVSSWSEFNLVQLHRNFILENHTSCFDRNLNFMETFFQKLQIVPEGFGNLLRKIRDEYGNPDVYILENGYSDVQEIIYDKRRMDYHYSYMKEMFKAVKDGCNVKAYSLWCLLDNFEWADGYE